MGTTKVSLEAVNTRADSADDGGQDPRIIRDIKGKVINRKVTTITVSHTARDDRLDLIASIASINNHQPSKRPRTNNLYRFNPHARKCQHINLSHHHSLKPVLRLRPFHHVRTALTHQPKPHHPLTLIESKFLTEPRPITREQMDTGTWTRVRWSFRGRGPGSSLDRQHRTCCTFSFSHLPYDAPCPGLALCFLCIACNTNRTRDARLVLRQGQRHALRARDVTQETQWKTWAGRVVRSVREREGTACTVFSIK